jgi:hypothetical protein
MPGNPKVRDLPAWVVVAEAEIRAPLPGSRTVFHRLCIVISATSGQYVIAYAADPTYS